MNGRLEFPSGMKRTTFAVAGLGLVLFGALLGWWIDRSPPSEPDAEAFRKLESAYEVIRQAYVEPVSPDSLARTSIQGMVRPLDAYSDYISRSRMKEVEETFSGSFEGIGITYDLISGPNGQDTIAVLSVVPGGPSAKAGLRAGDRIVRVNGESAIGWSHEMIRARVKGPQGSTVAVSLRRPRREERLDKEITRDEVPLQTVEAQYMMGGSTGYVRLGRFARTTHREVVEALQELDEDGMARLILDLRGNAGGLMTMAEKVADEFLVDDQLIVRARSRHEEYGGAQYASDGGLFEERPLIVLVDEHSASASEIVAGALQDHDRAFLVGRRTFGKGLVQRQFDFRDESGLRLTVARFYTPSGRLVQRSDDSDSLRAAEGVADGDPSALPDSMVHHTDAGRTVVGGGGILPDRIVTAPTRNDYRAAVEREGLVRDFARQWVDARGDSLRARWKSPAAFVTEFTLPATVYPAFVRYAAERGVRASTTAPVPTEDRRHGGEELRGPSGPPGETVYSASTVEAARSAIEILIKSDVGRRLFSPSVAIRIQNMDNAVVSEALQSWSTASAWADRYPVE